MSHAHRRVEDWQEWIERNIQTVREKYPGIIAPRALVVIGRSRDLSEDEARKLARRNANLGGRVRIWTYDHLIQSARSYIASIKIHLRKPRQS